MEQDLQFIDKLDFTLQISVPLQQDFISVFSKADLAVPLHMSVVSNGVEIFMYVSNHNMGKYESLISKFHHETKGNYKIFHVPANDLLAELRVFSSIIKVPSVVPGGFFLRSGSVHADFRFHHASFSEISLILKEIFSDDNRIRLDYLGPSFGLVSTLREINDRIPLSVLKVSYDSTESAISEDDYVAEAKVFSWMEPSDCKMVAFGRAAPHGCTTIDSDNCIFECPPRSEFFKSLYHRLLKDHIPVGSIQESRSSGRISVQIFVPTFISDKVVNSILQLSESVSLSNFLVELFVPFERWLSLKK
ncbi:hypothetical protein ApAK_04175 [Thermoplasmatales archaeon AK]|nr:hypothetical protein [Thermoplasmatales archaeon AK]